MLIPPANALDERLPGSVTGPLALDDVDELIVLQRACWVQEAIANDTLDTPPLHETREDVLADAAQWDTVVVRVGHRLVAAVRGRLDGDAWDVGRLMVAPDLAGRGVGSALLELAESLAPSEATHFALFTGARSERNIRTYERAGYRVEPQDDEARAHGIVRLTKPIVRD
ncbi:GNAT family N-acetyltransferase [Pseudoclavibacter chungangensis]|uniref:GNAT family N-acetyltransferase n=1 Tax=Pseudoclavibacter chungangensis TaxID=587635 RepID=A0A7J5C2T8_9MICO|nr:GNAT family N-acetyltransferase [Pseudoclavibacter chungangensis]KAB1662512.1 GNAT family N-acetyltransferase [Pseudoclavibacter chungangensis]NYJ68550.1 GNAT superfamily N-acetyltransferase [Pseudoclavibacter chungangensis]